MSASTPNVQRGFRSNGLGVALGTTALAVAIGSGLLIGQAVTKSAAPAAPISAEAQNFDNAYHAYLAGAPATTIDNTYLNGDPTFDQGWALDNAVSAPATSSRDQGWTVDNGPAGEHGSGGSNGTRLAR